MLIPASSTLAAVEDFLIKGLSETQISLPTNSRHQALGAEAALVQAITTWSNLHEQAVVRTFATSLDDPQLLRLARKLYGTAGIAVADEVLSRDRTISLKSVALQMARDRLKRMAVERPEQVSRGPQTEILCVDHLALSHPSSLYTNGESGEPEIRDLPAFRSLVRELITEKLIPSPYRQTLPPNFERAIAIALHELLRNTDEHGRTDDAGNLRRKSIRGFQARKHSLTPKSLREIAATSPPLANYCGGLMPARRDNAHVQMIEISVFDAGPGLASSLLGKHMQGIDVEEEREAVLGCFVKSVSRKNASSAGLGLPNLVAALSSVDGFMRVRTGRSAMFSNFAEAPVLEFGEPLQLRDWFEPGRQAPAVHGTLFTLLFPLRA